MSKKKSHRAIRREEKKRSRQTHRKIRPNPDKKKYSKVPKKPPKTVVYSYNHLINPWYLVPSPCDIYWWFDPEYDVIPSEEVIRNFEDKHRKLLTAYSMFYDGIPFEYFDFIYSNRELYYLSRVPTITGRDENDLRTTLVSFAFKTFSGRNDSVIFSGTELSFLTEKPADHIPVHDIELEMEFIIRAVDHEEIRALTREQEEGFFRNYFLTLGNFKYKSDTERHLVIEPKIKKILYSLSSCKNSDIIVSRVEKFKEMILKKEIGDS